MHLPSHLLSSATSDQTTISIASWWMWGFIVGAAITLVLLGITSLVAISFTKLTDGWQGGVEPWKDFGATFKGFIFYGLPVGLVSSYIWFAGHPWLAVIAGIAVFAFSWIVMAAFINRRRY